MFWVRIKMVLAALFWIWPNLGRFGMFIGTFFEVINLMDLHHYLYTTDIIRLCIGIKYMILWHYISMVTYCNSGVPGHFMDSSWGSWSCINMKSEINLEKWCAFYWPTPYVIASNGLSFIQPSAERIIVQSNRSVAQIPQCTSLMSHNAPFCNRNVHMCAHFCYKMVHCRIIVWCIVGFVIRAYYKMVP